MRPEGRTLGDVPGLHALLPSTNVLPSDYSVLEVNNLGEMTTDPFELTASGSSDPFAVDFGFLDDAASNGVEGGSGGNDPMRSSYLPTYDPGVSAGGGVPAPAGTGSETYGRVGNDPYALIQRDGETVDSLTAAALDAASKELGAGFHIIQGSHTTDYGPSGNTHAGGGVVDVAPTNGDWVGAMTALRKIGFAAWVRNLPGYGQAGSGAHIHAVLIGDEQLSPEAQTQVQSYLNNDDGLSGSRADDGPREFVNNRFVWGRARKQQDRWREQVVKTAQGHLGVPFKWGGEDVDGLDDVGLIRRVYKQLGVDMPKTAFDLAYGGDVIPSADAQPGDLIAWDGGDRVGIALGGGRLLEAGGPGRVVQLSEIDKNLVGAWGIPMQGRIAQMRQPARPAPYTPPPAPAPAPYTAPSMQGQMNAPVEQAPKGPKKNGPLQNTTFDQKPHLL